MLFDLEGHASAAGAKGLDEVDLGSDLGLDVVRKVVGVVAGEDLAARHGALGVGGPHLLDVVVIAGVDNGGDVKVGEAVPAAELDLAEHAGNVVLTLGDGVVVADPGVGEGDLLLLAAADGDGVEPSRLGVGSEVDGALNVVEGPEGDGGGLGEDSGGNEGHDGGGELHLERWGFG
jgi:hypothetical protein